MLDGAVTYLCVRQLDDHGFALAFFDFFYRVSVREQGLPTCGDAANPTVRGRPEDGGRLVVSPGWDPGHDRSVHRFRPSGLWKSMKPESVFPCVGCWHIAEAPGDGGVLSRPGKGPGQSNSGNCNGFHI